MEGSTKTVKKYKDAGTIVIRSVIAEILNNRDC